MLGSADELWSHPHCVGKVVAKHRPVLRDGGGSMWYWLFKYVFMGPLLSLLGRPKVIGLEYVPDSGPVILASNPLAVPDSFYLPLVVKRRITFLAKAEYFTGTGIKGWFSRWFYT